jgi:uncharacterized protein (TIGR02453 family)
MKFEGFPEQALVFYEGLEADNSKPYWTDNKSTYDSCCRAPMEALLAELESEFGAGKLFRPYRDVRFSRNKELYKTAIGATTQDGGYVQVSARGLMTAGGYYHTASDQVQRMRRAVGDDVRGPELERIVATLRRSGYQVDGEQLKTMPRGYPADHPRADLLRYKSMIAWRDWGQEPWLHTRQALTKVRSSWRAIRPLQVWLDTNVGPSDQPHR